MGTRAFRHVRDWLVPGHPPRRAVRIALDLALVLLLAAGYAATGSELVEFLAAVGFLLIVPPIASRVFPTEPDAFWQAVRAHGEPMRVFAPGLLAFLVLGAVEFFVPDLGLGAGFWMFASLALSFEFQDLVARRSFRAVGTQGWNEVTPLRYSGLAGVTTVPLVFLTAALFHDVELWKLSASAFASGVAVFLLGAILTVAIPATLRAVSTSQG
jgi:hypothetical protein